MQIFIEVTKSDGLKTMVNTSHIHFFRSNFMDIDGTHLYVMETREEIAKKVKMAIADLADNANDRR